MNKKFLLIVGICVLILVVILFCLGDYKIDENVVQNEIVPQEEISEEQERKTYVTLYYKEVNQLGKEARIIDAKLLYEEPYDTIMKMLLEGPKAETLERVIPESVQLNSVNIEGNIAYVDLTKEFAEITGLENESMAVYSIVNTLTELNEITFVRILIDGQENQQFVDGCMNFKESFERNV